MSKIKPNVLVIYTDQMRYDCMSCSGNPDVKTPYLERMAMEGVQFENAFVSYPLCTPFRASFLTGRYAHATGVYSNHFAIDPYRQPSLGPLFRDAGYRTGYIGKWHLYGGPKPGFVPPGPDRMGFDHFVGFNRGHQYLDAIFYRDTDQPYRCRRYEPDFQTDHTIEFMQSIVDAPDDSPFFAYVCFGPPHFPMKMPDYLKKMYDPEKIKLPEGTPDQEAQRQFIENRIEYDYDGNADLLEKSKAGSLKPGDVESEGDIRQFVADYYAMISNVDHNLGILLNWLQSKGILDETIVVFMSDHGDMLGQHGQFCGWKRAPYRGSAQVPFFIRYPERFTGGRKVTSLIDVAVDTMPSLLEICGLECPEGVQGISYVPVLEDDSPTRDAVYFQMMKQSKGGRGQRHPKPERGIRTKEWLYVRKQDKPVLLIDEEIDPLENNNLVESETHQEQMQVLNAELSAWMTETADDFDLEMPWPPKNFVSHKDADRLLKTDVHSRAILVP